MDRDTLKKLSEAPIEFVGQIACPGGTRSITLCASELDKFCEDPETFYANLLGITLDEYKEWVDSDGTPRCGEITTKGTRCRNPVSGGVQMSIGRWLEENGGLCTVHGGPTSLEAKK